MKAPVSWLTCKLISGIRSASIRLMICPPGWGAEQSPASAFADVEDFLAATIVPSSHVCCRDEGLGNRLHSVRRNPVETGKGKCWFAQTG